MTRMPLSAARTGRTFVVTGANSGIGREVTRELVARGAHVVLAVRDTAKGQQTATGVAGRGSTSVVDVDLSDLDAVTGCATTLLDRHDDIAGLVCNAGVMGGPLQLSPQGFERQMVTNHLGHAALVAALWPLLHASASRVVMVSSGEASSGQLSAATTSSSSSTRCRTTASRSTATASRPTCCSRWSCITAAPRQVPRSAPSPCTRAPSQVLGGPLTHTDRNLVAGAAATTAATVRISAPTGMTL